MERFSSSRRTVLCLIGFAPLLLAGCGRKADPKPPPDADPAAPRRYPVDRSAPPAAPSVEPSIPPQSPFPDPLAPLTPPPGYR